jgi:hypothetical protein
MRPIDNRWRGGEVHLQFPPPDPAMLGRRGVSFQEAIFDQTVGTETFVLLLDDPEYAAEMGGLHCLNLTVTCAVVRTSAGLIAVLIWRAGPPDKVLSSYEHLINLFGSLELVARAAVQQELKVVVGDNVTGEVVGFFPIKNDFGFDETLTQLRSVAEEFTPADFMRTQCAFFEEFTVEELLEL